MLLPRCCCRYDAALPHTFDVLTVASRGLLLPWWLPRCDAAAATLTLTRYGSPRLRMAAMLMLPLQLPHTFDVLTAASRGVLLRRSCRLLHLLSWWCFASIAWEGKQRRRWLINIESVNYFIHYASLPPKLKVLLNISFAFLETFFLALWHFLGIHISINYHLLDSQDLPMCLYQCHKFFTNALPVISCKASILLWVLCKLHHFKQAAMKAISTKIVILRTF